jgi:hypothetical protein
MPTLLNNSTSFANRASVGSSVMALFIVFHSASPSVFTPTGARTSRLIGSAAAFFPQRVSG